MKHIFDIELFSIGLYATICSFIANNNLKNSISPCSSFRFNCKSTGEYANAYLIISIQVESELNTYSFFGFSLYYALNTAFYSNEIIHKVYEDKGSYNLKYQFPLILYSSLISFVLNIFFKELALTNDLILNLKQVNSFNDMKIKIKNLEKKIRIKFILYFIITFILLIFFWYYISMFCAIYRNNQYLLLYNVLISLVLSICYPFGIYSICAIIRILSLSKAKKGRKCLYDFSKVLQKC